MRRGSVLDATAPGQGPQERRRRIGREPVYLVGLTGGIGSGKSTVAALLAQRGCDVIDADVVAREVVRPGEPALQELVDRFGPRIVRSDGSLDRSTLAHLAFADDDARRDLDRITHPHIAARIAERIARLAADARPNAGRIVVIDHPLLVETGQQSRFDAVVVVLADERVRVARLRERGMDEADARRRMAAQVDDDTRREAATHLVTNDGDLDDLARQVEALHQELGAAAAAAAGR